MAVSHIDPIYDELPAPPRALPPLVPRLDPAEAWARLDPEVQKRIGAAAIAATMGAIGMDMGIYPRQGFAAANLMAVDVLDRAVCEHVLPGDPERHRLALPDLWALGIQTCRECGCVEDCACPEGCGWVEDDLCSACADGLPDFTVEVSHPDLATPVLGVFHARTAAEAAVNAASAALLGLVPQDVDSLTPAEREDRLREDRLLHEQLCAGSTQRVWAGSFTAPPARPPVILIGGARDLKDPCVGHAIPCSLSQAYGVEALKRVLDEDL